MDDWKGLPLEVRYWLAVGLVVVLVAAVVLAALGDWFRTWWLTNLFRNRLDAKRRLRREGREPDVKA